VKILITTEQYYPIQSGVSSVVTSIAEELYKQGYEVDVATGFQDRNKLVYNGVNIIEFKVYGGFGNYYKGETQKYKDFILNSSYDVIINECVQTWTTDLILKYLHLLKGKKILHSHGFSLLSYRTKNPWAYIKSKFYYYSLYKFLKNYDHIFLLHDRTIETSYLNKYGIKNYSYLPNGVDKMFLEKCVNKNEKYLINISNYYPMKYQEFLLEAFYKSETTYKLILVGATDLKNYLKKLQQLKKEFDNQYGEKNVEFLFNIPREQTVNYLKKATLFLHSSQLEVFPMVIVESMAKGIPFISTDVGNVSALPGGFVVHSRDEMAKKIDFLLNDKIIYNNKSSEGFSMIQNELNWTRIIKRMEYYFEKN